jgi:nitrate/TMAO reductase-like tetraheme cytochrome c subunit
MAAASTRPATLRTLAARAAALLLLLSAWGFAARAEELSEAVTACLDCHADDTLTMAFDDGDEISLFVDATGFAQSVHGSRLVCTDCHEGYDNGEHPSGATFASEQAYRDLAADTCKRCHFETYTRTLESVHFELRKEGSSLAPSCTDCHGTHDTPNPHAKSDMMSRSCGSCHADVYDVYATSVHGKALARNGDSASPACADCHTAHAIADPSTNRFHVSTPAICIECHGNETTMAPYGLSTDVATTYLADFHGVTASLAPERELDKREVVVTCVDCHGVHDIATLGGVAEAQMKEKVKAVCADCHQGAAQDFPDAWLSHFQPSLSHAPLVYLVEIGYKLLIPFMIGGLALQVLLHLYRLAGRR